MIKEAYNNAIGAVQRRYDQYRPPELHGSPKTSSPFFDSLRNGDILGGTRNFVRAHENLGRQDLAPTLKAAMSLIGSAIECTGIRDAARSENRWVNTPAQILHTATICMLMACHVRPSEARKYSITNHETGPSVSTDQGGFLTRSDVRRFTGVDPGE